MYIIRLDDASYLMDTKKWEHIERLLDKYSIKPIVGVIPKNEDQEFQKYVYDDHFWEKALNWQNKGWLIALHGFEHKYITNNGGINPIHNRSEFAGLSIIEQREKIKNGYSILLKHKLNPTIFFAPSHTYDDNTLLAIKEETNIRIISDTIANDIYYNNDFYFIPVQTGKARKLPLKVVTICLHPNEMSEEDFKKLELFIQKNKTKFNSILLKNRKYGLYDYVLKIIYFLVKKIKKSK